MGKKNYGGISWVGKKKYLNLGRRSGGSISVNDLPILVDKELGEVPLDAVAQQPSTFLWLQVLVKWRLLWAIHINLSPQQNVHKLPRAAHMFLTKTTTQLQHFNQN